MTPSASPTFTPSVSPSITPSITPSFSPSISPSQYPSIAPSLNPTFSPSQFPSNSPTKTPTNAPTYSPSIAPSSSPTIAPTNNPISNKEFDSYLLIKYLLEHIGDMQNDIVENKYNVIRDIKWTIKRAYFDQDWLEYQQFDINILKIEGINVNNIDKATVRKTWSGTDKLTLETKCHCSEDTGSCAFIKQKSKSSAETTGVTNAQQTTDFESTVQSELRSYFDNDKLLFTVIHPDALTIKCKYCATTKFNWFLLISGCIVGLIIIVAICAFLYNKQKFPKLPGFNIVDDARWTAVIGFALQFYDFISDINLTIEMWTRNDIFNDFMILVAGIGSAVFIIIPYTANIIIASRVKTLIRNNSAAKAWFQHHTSVFTLLVVFTGGCYPALAMVSSGIFGLNIMTSGLTKYELKQLSKIKVFSSIVLENAPQLLFQGIYASRLGEITNNTALAFIASLLSITASILAYWIEKDAADTKVVQYYLSTECKDRVQVYVDELLPDDVDTNINTIQHGEEDEKSIGEETNLKNISSVNNGITDEEKENLLNNRGRTEALEFEITEVFGIPNKTVEVGYSTITKYGLITHIVHYVHDDDLKTLEEEINIDISPLLYVKQLYEQSQLQINQIFIRHFNLNEQFSTQFIHRLTIKNRSKSAAISDNVNDINDNSNQIELAKMENIGNKHDNDNMQQILHGFFEKQNIVNKVDKIKLLSELLGNTVENALNDAHDYANLNDITQQYDNEMDKKLDDEALDLILDTDTTNIADINVDQLFTINADILELQKSISGIIEMQQLEVNDTMNNIGNDHDQLYTD